MFSPVNDTSKGIDEMISLQPVIPIPQNFSELDRLLMMMAFLGDAEACKARLGELRQCAGESAAIVAQADALRAEIAKEREALKAERAVQEKQLAAAAGADVARRGNWEAELKAREAESEKQLAATLVARQEAEKLRDDLKLRVERVKSAAA
jgi:hypothetical protein